MTVKELVELLLAVIIAILGTTWLIKQNIQKISQKQKSGKGSINIAISNNYNKEK